MSDPMGYAVYKAAKDGNEAELRRLIGLGGNVNWHNPEVYGHTALISAADHGHEGCVKILLESEAIEVNATDTSGASALHGAAFKGHLAIAKRLLERGADPTLRTNPKLGTKRDWGSKTALDNAKRQKKWEVVALLSELRWDKAAAAKEAKEAAERAAEAERAAAERAAAEKAAADKAAADKAMAAFPWLGFGLAILYLLHMARIAVASHELEDGLTVTEQGKVAVGAAVSAATVAATAAVRAATVAATAATPYVSAAAESIKLGDNKSLLDAYTGIPAEYRPAVAVAVLLLLIWLLHDVEHGGSAELSAQSSASTGKPVGSHSPLRKPRTADEKKAVDDIKAETDKALDAMKVAANKAIEAEQAAAVAVEAAGKIA
eukprot:jgi/Chrpa1/24435/Chrysochromulina_OHIO_Genome00007287-RA